jgi:hypothetical protein
MCLRPSSKDLWLTRWLIKAVWSSGRAYLYASVSTLNMIQANCGRASATGKACAKMVFLSGLY